MASKGIPDTNCNESTPARLTIFLSIIQKRIITMTAKIATTSNTTRGVQFTIWDFTWDKKKKKKKKKIREMRIYIYIYLKKKVFSVLYNRYIVFTITIFTQTLFQWIDFF